ncbi:MAG: tRNA (adenosine(37)-N6)-threonylcarbamoyltransferase complex dimerization subunit type 1 TsaB [Gammaproteobacteria bacterium]
MTGVDEQSLPKEFRCLAIETSSAVSSIAACAGGRVARAEYGSPGEQSRQVYSCVRDVLRDVSLELGDLDCIAFGAGPGGFTGLRVGASVAQSLAFGQGLRVCSISSLAVLAAGAMRRHGAPTIAACVDARMGEAYLGVYRSDGGRLAAELDDRLVDPANFALPFNQGDSLFAVGGGWSAYPELLEANASLVSASETEAVPDAVELLILAASEFAADRTVAPHEAVPNYVRNDVTS